MIKLNTEYLKQIFTKYDYIMTTAQLNLEKLYYRDIQQMLKKGMIEKVKRGYYHWIEDNDCKEVVIINKLFPDAILCMETALFYYSYSDRNPAELDLCQYFGQKKLKYYADFFSSSSSLCCGVI